MLFLINFILFVLMVLGGTSLSSLLYYLHYGLWFSTIFQPLELDCGAFLGMREASVSSGAFAVPYLTSSFRFCVDMWLFMWMEASLLSTCSLHLPLLCGLSSVTRSSELQSRDTQHWIESHHFNQLDFLEAFYKSSKVFHPFITFIAADILTFPFFFNKFSSTKKKNKKE